MNGGVHQVYFSCKTLFLGTCWHASGETVGRGSVGAVVDGAGGDHGPWSSERRVRSDQMVPPNSRRGVVLIT